MGLYNFQARFVPFIERGEKTHTIRAKRKYPDKVGNILHLYTGLRHKNARLLMRARCVMVEEIEILDLPDWGPVVRIDGAELDCGEAEQLAVRDGFPSFKEMLKFWEGRLPFKGDVVHWELGGRQTE